MALRGLPFDARVQASARRIMSDYCLELEVSYQIKCRPLMTFNRQTGVMTLDIEPVTEQDKRWLAAISTGLSKSDF